jgi:hypothetical protein
VWPATFTFAKLLSIKSLMILINSVDITWFYLFFLFFVSLFAHLHGILQLEDTCNTSFFGLYTYYFLSG